MCRIAIAPAHDSALSRLLLKVLWTGASLTCLRASSLFRSYSHFPVLLQKLANERLADEAKARAEAEASHQARLKEVTKR